MIEQSIEKEIQDYRKKLERMDLEDLSYEFNDKLGCDASDYFSNPINYYNREKWIDVLLEKFSFETKMDNHIRKINELTKQINSI